MVFDIIIGVILIVTMVFGFRKGFIYSIIHTLGWFGAMVAAFFAAGPVRKLVEANTDISDRIYLIFAEKLSISSDTLHVSLESLPPLVGQGIDTSMAGATEILAEKLTLLTMTILCFIVTLLVIKAIIFLVTIGISSKKKGFTGAADGILGLVAGLLRGAVFVFLFLAVLVPLVNLVSPVSTQLVVDSLNSSHLAGTLYDNNFLVNLMEDYLS